MQKEYILQASLLDIVFDKRNKNYGAYELRKLYKSRLLKALCISFGFALIFSLLAVFYKPIEQIRQGLQVIGDGVVLREYKISKPILPSAPPRKVASSVIPVGQAVSSNVAIVEDGKTAPIKTGAGGPDVPASDPGEQGPVSGPPLEGGPGPVAPPVEPVQPKPDPAFVHHAVEVMPSFPGGMEALRKFLEKNLRNPGEAEEGQVISVKIRFIVGYDGQLKGFQIIEDGGDQYNKEVIRVLKKMPAWIPGKTKGESVSVYYTIPVKFTGAE